MAINYEIDPADDWPVFDFTQLVTYDPTGATAAITGLTAIRRPISQSAGRRIEQFDIGDGLNPDDTVFHICDTDAGALAAIDLTPYDFATSTSKDTITDADAVVYDVIFVERQVDNSKLFCVARKQ
jgi:hypothetical protein